MEVDLTKDTPPKKLKQAKLFFAPPVKKDAGGRKRKLSAEPEDKTPSKAAKLEIAPNMKEKETESKGQLNEKRESNKKKNKKSNDLPKKSKRETEDKSEDESRGLQGLLKMPFKKSKKKNEKKEDSDDDIELEGEAAGKEGKEPDEEETSMTEEWAKYHENHQSCDETAVEVKKSTPTNTKKLKSTKKTVSNKKEDAKPIETDKVLQECITDKSNAEKEKQKSILKTEKEKLKLLEKVEAPKAIVEDEEKPKVQNPEKLKKIKSNPLLKFLTKAKPTPETKISEVNSQTVTAGDSTTKNAEDGGKSAIDAMAETEGIQVISEIPGTPTTTSTPRRTSPRKKVTAGTPLTPDPFRTKQLAIAKLKVRITELNINMEKAVEDKDFLKAHEAKQSISKLEDELKCLQNDEDTSYESQSLLPDPATPVSTTPKAATSRNVSVVTTPGSAAGTGSVTKKLTPARAKKQDEAKAKKEALEKERIEKKERLAQEKLAKKEALEKEKAEKERKKEIEKKAKEVEKLHKEKVKKHERELAEAEKLKAKQEKEEEKMKKKLEKEAEQKLKEEEKKAKEEDEKEKAKKKAETFKSFFSKSAIKVDKIIESEAQPESSEGRNLSTFTVKKNTRLAPLVRNDPDLAKKRIDSLEMPCGPDGLYLTLLKSGSYSVGKQGRTWPYEVTSVEADEEVEILENGSDDESDLEDELNETNENIILQSGKDALIIPRAKMLKFHENKRPAYWGTWTKKSKFITGRRPFGRDEDRFDYDYDSDDDWEEEEEGESLSDAEDDKEKEEDNEDYEVDNTFFVPHGYLSDEEEIAKDEDEVFDPEFAKEKQKRDEKEFEKEHKKKTQVLKPKLWGVYYESEVLDTEAAAVQLAKILGSFEGFLVGNNNTVETTFSKPEHASPSLMEEVAESASKLKPGKKAQKVPEEALPELIRLVHGNSNNKMFLAREFLEFWKRKVGGESKAEDAAAGGSDTLGTPAEAKGGISKRKCVDKIHEIADYRRQKEGGVKCWWVKQEVLNRYEVDPSKEPEWNYILEQPNKHISNNADEPAGSRPGSPSLRSAAPSPANLITKFARVLTDEEKEEAKAKQEREALLAKLKREAARAEKAAKEAREAQLKEEAAAAAAVPKPVFAVTGNKKVCVVSTPGSAATKKRVALTPVAAASPVQAKKAVVTDVTGSPVAGERVPLVTITNPAKNNPITAIAGSDIQSAKKSPRLPLPFAKASPIAVKRKPSQSSATLSFAGKITAAAAATPDTEEVEIVTLD